MMSVPILFDPKDYELLRDALIERYGPPHARTQDTVTTRAGAQFQNEPPKWSGAKTWMIALERRWTDWRHLWLSQGVAFLFLLAACAKPSVVTVPPPRPVFVGYELTGTASWYGEPYHGRRTASGEVYDMSQMTAAHRSLPFGSWVVVENLLNRRTVEVRITDRGPFTGDRILDLSQAAARVLGAVGPGTIPVRLRVVALPGSTAEIRGGFFTVQVAAFSSEDRAAMLKSVLDQDWAETYVQRVEVGGRTVYRVRVGKAVTRTEAQRLAQRLAAAGYDVIVVAE